MAFDLLLRNANLPDGRTGIDIGVACGRIVAIGADLPAEAGETIDASKLVVAAEAEGESAVAQRLGYLLERMGAAKAAAKLFKWLDLRSPKLVLLAPNKPGKEIARDARWRVIVNVELEPDQP